MGELPSKPEVPWRVGDLVAVFLLTLLCASGAAGAVAAAVQAGALPERVGSMVLLPLSPILLGAVCWLYLAFRHRGTVGQLFGTTTQAVRDIGFGVGLGLLAMLMQVVILGAANAITEVPMEDVQAPIREAVLDPELRPVLILGAVLLAPFSEELFFRGMAYQTLRKSLGVRWGIVASAAFFAVVHVSVEGPLVGNLVLFVVIFVVGALLAHAFERRGNLIAPMAMHATFNLLSLGGLLVQELGLA